MRGKAVIVLGLLLGLAACGHSTSRTQPSMSLDSAGRAFCDRLDTAMRAVKVAPTVAEKLRAEQLKLDAFAAGLKSSNPAVRRWLHGTDTGSLQSGQAVCETQGWMFR